MNTYIITHFFKKNSKVPINLYSTRIFCILTRYIAQQKQVFSLDDSTQFCRLQSENEGGRYYIILCSFLYKGILIRYCALSIFVQKNPSEPKNPAAACFLTMDYGWSDSNRVVIKFLSTHN